MNKTYQFIHELSPEEAYEKLMAIGEEEEAQQLAETITEDENRLDNYGIFDMLSSRPWRHTEHTFGFIQAQPGENMLPIVSPGQTAADPELKNSKLTISLDRLNVADYPGKGVHQILFDFYAENRLEDGSSEKVRFNQVCRVHEGQSAGIINYPIFVDLNVGERGLSFNCLTINVKNTDDERFLQFLEGDIFKTGLKLLGGFQPAILPLSETMENITKTIASRNRNIPVQEFHLGLDFDNTPTGLRLRLGSYIAVQIPENVKNNWDWNQWRFDTTNGRIVNQLNPETPFNFNYIIFGIKRN